MKVTANGAVPLVALVVKLETGVIVAAETLMNVTCVEIPCPALLDAFNTMEIVTHAKCMGRTLNSAEHYLGIVPGVTFLNDQLHAVGV